VLHRHAYPHLSHFQTWWQLLRSSTNISTTRMQRRPSTSVISNLIALHSDDCLVCSISVSIIYHLSYCCIYHLPVTGMRLSSTRGYHLLFLESSFSLLSSLFFLFFQKNSLLSAEKFNTKISAKKHRTDTPPTTVSPQHSNFIFLCHNPPK